MRTVGCCPTTHTCCTAGQHNEISVRGGVGSSPWQGSASTQQSLQAHALPAGHPLPIRSGLAQCRVVPCMHNLS